MNSNSSFPSYQEDPQRNLPSEILRNPNFPTQRTNGNGFVTGTITEIPMSESDMRREHSLHGGPINYDMNMEEDDLERDMLIFDDMQQTNDIQRRRMSFDNQNDEVLQSLTPQLQQSSVISQTQGVQNVEHQPLHPNSQTQQHVPIAQPTIPMEVENVERHLPIQSQGISSYVRDDIRLIESYTEMIEIGLLEMQSDEFPHDAKEPPHNWHIKTNIRTEKICILDIIERMCYSKFKCQHYNEIDEDDETKYTVSPNIFKRASKLLNYFEMDDTLYRVIFEQCTDYRTQIYILHNILPISYRCGPLAAFFGICKASITSQIKRMNLELEGQLKENGRPSNIPDDVVQKVETLLRQQTMTTQYLTIVAIKTFVDKECQRNISYSCVYNLVTKRLGFKFVPVVVEERGRVEVSIDDVLGYYLQLKEKYAGKIKASMFMNLDEMGVNGNESHGKKFVLVPGNFPNQSVTVSDAGDSSTTSTLISCISLSGDTVATCVVVNKAFAFYDTTRYYPDVVHYFCKSGFATAKIFELFFEHQVIPSVKEMRRKYRLPDDEPAVLLMDNASVHRSNELDRLAGENNIFIEWLIPHTSHLCQPLDTCVFGVTKDALAQLRSVYKAENTAMNVMTEITFDPINDDILGNFTKVGNLLDKIKDTYSFLTIPDEIFTMTKKFQHFIASEQSVNKMMKLLEKWFRENEGKFVSGYRKKQQSFIASLSMRQHASSETTASFDCFNWIESAILDAKREFVDMYNEMIQLMTDYKETVIQMNMNDEFISQQLLTNDTFNQFDQLTTVNSRRERYQAITEKLMKMLKAYDKATTRTTIINSFERVGITSYLVDCEWTMYVDISKAERINSKYRQIVSHECYKYLTEKPTIQRTYVQVVIPDDELRERMSTYAQQHGMTVIRSPATSIIEWMRERARQHFGEMMMMNHPHVHVPQIQILPAADNSSNHPNQRTNGQNQRNTNGRGNQQQRQQRQDDPRQTSSNRTRSRRNSNGIGSSGGAQ